MKNLATYISEKLVINKKYNSSNENNDVIDNFELILNNLRKDNRDYNGAIAKMKHDYKILSVINKDVWGEYDSPVNKLFDRNRKSPVKLNEDDMVVLIWDTLGNDRHPGANGLKNLYICKYKDEWYYQNRDDADEFMEQVDIIEEA